MISGPDTNTTHDGHTRATASTSLCIHIVFRGRVLQIVGSAIVVILLADVAKASSSCHSPSKMQRSSQVSTQIFVAVSWGLVGLATAVTLLADMVKGQVMVSPPFLTRMLTAPEMRPTA